ncbi:MAG: hypothetical protein ACR2HR_10635, partial [Euzebya sp.]
MAGGMGFALGGFEALIPARLETFGFSPEAAGPLLALTAVGSGVAGVVAANNPNQLRRGRVVGGVLILAFAVVYLPAAAAPTVVLLGVALLILGAPIAPLNALANMGLQRILAEERQAEGFSVYPAMILIGAGSGQFGAGWLLGHYRPETLLAALAVLPATLGVVLLLAAARRRSQGLPPGVGCDHDPTVADPASYAT